MPSGVNPNVTYMAISADEYEIPLAVSETIGGLAKTLGKEYSTLCRAMAVNAISNEEFNGKRYRIIKVKDG